MKNINILLNNGVNVQKSLELFGDMATYDETLVDFDVEVPSKVEKLIDYNASGDMENYAIYVHSLKSDARYFGFDKLADMAYEHEMKSKAKDHRYVSEHINELIMEANSVIEIVKQYLYGSNNDPVMINEEVEELAPCLLVVDDSPIILSFVKKIFSNDYEILSAKNGQEAIDLMKANRVEGMLLDLNMPIMNGYAVLEYMKENNLFDTVPVSIISGSDDSESVKNAFVYPIVDMLNKPFNEESIKVVLDKTINSKKW